MSSCVELWSLFKKILSSTIPASFLKSNANETQLNALDQLLSKAPGLLEKWSDMIVSVPEEEEDVSNQKPNFVYWLIRRLILLWHVNSNDSSERNSRSSNVLSTIILVTQLRDPPFCRAILDDFLKLLSDLSLTSDLYLDDMNLSIRLSKFGISVEDDEMFSSEDTELVINNPEAVEFLQIRVTELLAATASALASFSAPKLAQVWSILSRQMEVGDVPLKRQSILLAAALIQCKGSITSNHAVIGHFLRVFAAVIDFTLLEKYRPREKEIGDSLHGPISVCIGNLCSAQLDEIELEHFSTHFSPIWLNILSSEHWSKCLDKYECLWQALLLLVSHKKFRFIRIDKLSDFILHRNSTLGTCMDRNSTVNACIEEILTSLVAQQIFESQGWKDKKVKMVKREEATMTLEPNFSGESGSKIWQNLLEMTKQHLAEKRQEFVVQLTVVARKILLDLQQRESFHVEIDFFGKSFITDIVQMFVDLVISVPSTEFIEPLENIIFVQPKDTFTQGILNQIIALASMPWLSGSAKLGDLRIGETLTHNLIKASSLQKASIDLKHKCISLISCVSKEVAPKWRMTVIRTAWSEGGATSEAVLDSLPFFIHFFGPMGHPLALEIIQQAVDSKIDQITVKVATSAGFLVCSLTNHTRVKRTGNEEVLFCPDCSEEDSPESDDGKVVFMAKKSRPVASKEVINVLLRLVGHSNPKVSVAMLQLLKPLSIHCGISAPAAEIWLNCIDEENEELALAFSRHIHFLLRPCDDQTNWNAVCLAVVAGLRDACKRAVKAAIFNFSEAVSCCLVCIARLPFPTLEKPILELMLDLLLSKSTHISIFCHAQELIKKGITAHQSVMTAKLAEKMCEGNPKDSLDSLIMLYKNISSYKFLSQQSHKIVPNLVLLCARSDQSGPLLFIAEQLDEECRKMLESNFVHIYPHIVIFSKDTAEFHKCCAYYEKESKQNISEALLGHRQKVIAELMLHFHSHQQRVAGALQVLAKADTEFMQKAPKGGQIDIAGFILPRFMLGILGKFDRLLNNPFVHLDRKREIIRALADIIKFMGPKNVATVKHKIMSLMKTAFHLKKNQEFEELLLKAWESFIKTIDVTLVGPVLPQILASLVQLFDSSAAKVVDLLNYLIIQNRSTLKPYYSRLNFLPEYSELKSVNDLIRVESKLNMEGDFSSVLVLMTNSISESENVEVKSQTLIKMLQVLNLNQTNLQGLILLNELVDPVVSNLVFLLVKCARDKDNSVSGLAAKCLGCIGAIDPGRLHSLSDLNLYSNISLSVTEEVFAIELINQLVRAYLSTTESIEGDACSFSIQEILKAYEITGSDLMSTFGGYVWQRLSDRTRELLQPLLVSLYSKTDRMITYSVPLILSEHGQNYHDWLSNWGRQLMQMIKDPKVTKIFLACKESMKKDIQTAQFLIPYIAIYAICESNADEKSEIFEEFKAVLNMSLASDSLCVTRTPSDSPKAVGHDIKWLATQTLFSILDHMNKWLRKKYMTIVSRHRRLEDPEVLTSKDKDFMAVKQFVASIPQILLARASFGCEGYARSLMHFESHLREKPDELLETSLPELQKIYGALMEPDYVAGLSMIRKEKPSLEEMIHEHTVMANFQDALACYESLGRNCDGSDIECGIINCYLQIDQPHTASILVKGLIEKKPEMNEQLQKFRIEAAWQLAQWEDIEDVNFAANETCWSHGLGAVLHTLHRRDSKDLNRWLDTARLYQTVPIAAAAMEQGSYPRCYENVVRLQILDEIATMSTIVLKNSPITKEFLEVMDLTFSHWKSRIAYSLYSLPTLEPVLKVRRALFNLALELTPEKESTKPFREMVKSELGECWILSAKVARKAGQYNKAFKLLLECRKFDLKEAFIEKAKLLWVRNNQGEAISVLKRGIEDQFPGYSSEKKPDPATPLKGKDLIICGKSKLLLAQYLDESATIEADLVNKYYESAKAVLGNTEDGFYWCANYSDKILGKNYTDSDLDKKSHVVPHIISQYGRSLVQGSKHLHKSLPRILSLWFDYASRICELEHVQVMPQGVNLAENKKRLKSINDFMLRLDAKYPSYIWLAAFPQLTSRICHSHPEVWSILRGIIIKTFLKFPNQVFWHMVALSKSSYLTRAARSKEIFDHVKAKSATMAKLIDGGLKLVDLLVKLADEKIQGNGDSQLQKVSPGLVRLIGSGVLNQLIIPTTPNMTMMLPTVSTDENDQHNPFPSGLVFIQGIEDQVVVMKSLVMPKKLTFFGSDGKKYSFLCKPKDDLRRDCRLVDFNNLLNKLFMRDPESRKRDLHIRTYTVIPLNETTGIIEWINNLQALRPIIMKIHRERLGKNMMRHEEIRDNFQTSESDVAKNKKNFTILLKRNPPVFAYWFVQNFPDPQAWYMARLAYTRTTAVMSMVGYLLGLGDRHGENILFDGSNGDTVHVDLNCLFNKGRELKIPEIVPFRLTHNMVQAMGPTGYEGPFRISCEVAVALMRKQKDILMSSLRPFVFDPLVDWVPNGKHKKTDTGEIVNEKALDTLRGIENRLDGIIEPFKPKDARAMPTAHHKTIEIPLSTTGQVDHLIQEATSFDRLSQMYMGWAPYF